MVLEKHGSELHKKSGYFNHQIFLFCERNGGDLSCFTKGGYITHFILFLKVLSIKYSCEGGEKQRDQNCVQDWMYPSVTACIHQRLSHLRELMSCVPNCGDKSPVLWDEKYIFFNYQTFIKLTCKSSLEMAEFKNRILSTHFASFTLQRFLLFDNFTNGKLLLFHDKFCSR